MRLGPVRPSVADRDPDALVRGYYRAIDAGDYASLADLLTPGFVQVRGDRTLEGREAFVRFMREGRPATDTRHEVETVYATDDGPADVAVRGRLRRADGTVGFGFVDVFTVADGRLDRLVTYTNTRVG